MFGFVILSILIFILNTYIFFELILINFIVFFLLGVFFKKAIPYSLYVIIILFGLYGTRETIDININKSKYYYSFEPLMKLECLAEFHLIEEKVYQNIHCKNKLTEYENEEIITHLKKNEKTIKHLKKMGCYSIEFSENLIQLWCNDAVIDIWKSDNNKIIYETSELK